MHLIVQAAILGPPHRRRVRADGERTDARLRRHAGDQRRAGRDDHRSAPTSATRCSPHLQIDPFVSILIMTPAAFVVGVGGAARVPAAAAQRRARGAVAARHVGDRARASRASSAIIYQTTYRATRPSYVNDSLTMFGYDVSVVRLVAFAASLRDPGAALPDAPAHAVRPGDPRHRPEPDGGQPARRRVRPRVGATASASASPRPPRPARCSA